MLPKLKLSSHLLNQFTMRSDWSSHWRCSIKRKIWRSLCCQNLWNMHVKEFNLVELSANSFQLAFAQLQLFCRASASGCLCRFNFTQQIKLFPPIRCAIKFREIRKRKKFLKNCYLTFSAIIIGQRTFFSVIKLVFWEIYEFYLFCCNVIFKDRILFK